MYGEENTWQSYSQIVFAAGEIYWKLLFIVLSVMIKSIFDAVLNDLFNNLYI